jgi:hypothetical protein
MESPIPILPLPTPDAETEKLIRMKDEEVGWWRGWARIKGDSRQWWGGAGPGLLISHPDLTPSTS